MVQRTIHRLTVIVYFFNGGKNELILQQDGTLYGEAIIIILLAVVEFLSTVPR